jgi:hypothetical protein
MNVIKRLIRLPFNLLGLQIISTKGYKRLLRKMDQKLIRAKEFYLDSLKNRHDSLSDPEYLQLLELKFGGYITEVPATIDSSKVKKIYGENHTGGGIE